jgi:hypothetical protein
MLLVSTCQVRYPILRLILMKTDDLALHCCLACCDAQKPDLPIFQHDPLTSRGRFSATLGAHKHWTRVP